MSYYTNTNSTKFRYFCFSKLYFYNSTPMKTTFLTLALTFSLFCAAQNPITSFYSVDNATYKQLSAAGNLDHSATGANKSWDFSGLSSIGTSADTNATPTSTEITTYPNTTNISQTTIVIGTNNTTSKIYTQKAGSVVSLTGVNGQGLDLNYNTNNATIGTFPMSFGATNTDALAGTYLYTTYTGTFTGNITNTFDSYGSLHLTIDGNMQMYSNVTRLKSVQTLSLNYGPLSGIGTATVTMYFYFDASNTYNVPVFRSTQTVINIPLLNLVNKTTTQLESFVGVLANPDFELDAKLLTVTPNPASNMLNFKNNSDLVIDSISIVDINGRTIKNIPYFTEEVTISDLESGTYFVKFNANRQSFTRKIIKL